MSLSKVRYVVFSLAAGGLLLVGLFLLLSGALGVARADPADLFVSPSGSGTGCSQAAPCSLSTALAGATSGDTIYLATGRYTGTGGAVVTVTQSIALLGGWDGSPAGDVVRDPAAYPATLDGENARRVVFIGGLITPTVDGLVVTGGNATGLGGDLVAYDAGGGICVSEASPIIAHNIISGNVAATGSSWSYGGGIFVVGSSAAPVIGGNLIARNAANSADSGKGGGLTLWYNSHAVVSRNVFRENMAGVPVNSQGGGVFMQHTSAVFSYNLFEGNKASSAGGGFGGGLNCQDCVVTLEGNLFRSNAADHGTVTLSSPAVVTLTNNILARNPAGGVFVRGSESDLVVGLLVNNTFALNGQPSVYAGYYNTGHTRLTLVNNIMVSNTTGIYAYTHTNPNLVTATHTLFYGNALDRDGPTISSTHEITGRDPLLVDPTGWNCHLREASPAVDAGLALPWLTGDIDGQARPWPAGGGYDIGADEVHIWRIYLPLLEKAAG